MDGDDLPEQLRDLPGDPANHRDTAEKLLRLEDE